MKSLNLETLMSENYFMQIFTAAQMVHSLSPILARSSVSISQINVSIRKLKYASLYSHEL